MKLGTSTSQKIIKENHFTNLFYLKFLMTWKHKMDSF